MNTEYKFACDEFTEVPEDVDEFIDWLNAQVKKQGLTGSWFAFKSVRLAKDAGALAFRIGSERNK